MISITTVEISVNNKPITKYNHKDKTFVEGRPGSSYSIKIHNRGDIRKKVVVSVDGLSIIDGEPASENSPGYIIEPYSTEVFEGWRTSDDNVVQFVFGKKKNSYSNKSGHGTTNTGVIGVLVFDEKSYNYNYRVPIDKFINWHDYDTNKVTRSVGNLEFLNEVHTSRAINSVNNVGTGFGDLISSKVTTTNFTSLDYPSQTILIYYDDRKGLESRGIVVNYRKSTPKAFPASTQYCKVL